MVSAVAPILNNEPATYFQEVGPHFPAIRHCKPVGEPVDHIQLIRDEVIIPILEAADPAEELNGRWEKFRELRDELMQARLEKGKLCDDDILQKENEIDSQLRAIFEGASEGLGESYIKAILSSLQLRKIIRETVLPEIKTWPTDSLVKIGDRMVLNELCLACILHYLTTSADNLPNAKFLAGWSYHYADYAYAEAGFSGKNHVPKGGSKPA